MRGTLSKLKSDLDSPIRYSLPVGESFVDLNPLLGQVITLNFTGQIFCTHCGRKTKKSFDQGYCYPCFRALAQCDMCIMKPELCHFEQGTCREPEWGESFCFNHHTVYLSNTSGLKVGITRNTQVPTRWIDQGAVQAIPVFQVANRLHSGLVEVTLGKYVADKTKWQAMLKNQVERLDMREARDALLDQCRLELDALKDQLGENAIQFLDDAQAIDIDYPVLEFPTKITSLNAEKTPIISGTLMGIKGQYLLLDTGVINIRKFTGYEVEVAS